MLRLTTAALAFAAMTTCAVAQTGTSPGNGQTNAQNSGAGIAGQPGNKNGPAVRPQSGTMGAGSSSSQAPATGTSPDASKIPGQPGNKSGPAVKPPSSSSGR
jgi:hypothetical protein